MEVRIDVNTSDSSHIRQPILVHVNGVERPDVHYVRVSFPRQGSKNSGKVMLIYGNKRERLTCESIGISRHHELGRVFEIGQPLRRNPFFLPQTDSTWFIHKNESCTLYIRRQV